MADDDGKDGADDDDSAITMATAALFSVQIGKSKSNRARECLTA